MFSPQLVDGGILILSRYPLLDVDRMVYNEGSGADGVSSKGVLYALVKVSPHNDGSIHAFTTHTQVINWKVR